MIYLAQSQNGNIIKVGQRVSKGNREVISDLPSTFLLLKNFNNAYQNTGIRVSYRR